MNFNYLYSQVGKSKLLLAIDDYGNKAKNFLHKVGNKDVKLILGEFIYPDKPLLNNEAKVNREVLSRYINKSFPDKNQSGIGVLDWEGRSLDLLITLPSTDSVYQSVLIEFLFALKLAKTLRPKVSWGFFGIPFKQGNFKTRKGWEEGNNKIAPLLKSVDVFCPNLYGYNPSDLGNKEDVLVSIKLGLKFGKKVYPFIWHRYNGGDQVNYTLKLIPKLNFVNYAKETFTQKYHNKKVDGIIWWAKDTYFYESKVEMLLNEKPPNEKFIDYYDSLLIDYTKTLTKSIK